MCSRVDVGVINDLPPFNLIHIFFNIPLLPLLIKQVSRAAAVGFRSRWGGQWRGS